MPVSFISIPQNAIVDLPRIGFGHASITSEQASQESRAFYELYHAGFFEGLTSISIARRMWTALHYVTASATIYDGESTFITGTLGANKAFVVLYQKDGTPLAVYRPNGTQSTSPTMHIWTIEQMCKTKGINPADVGDIQLIVASDGLTKTYSDEDKLLEEIKKHNPQGKLSPAQLVATLLQKSRESGSEDNLSAIAHSIRKRTRPFVAALSENNSGFAARWIGVHLKRLFSMSDEQYNFEEKFSVARNQQSYDENNKKLEEEFWIPRTNRGTTWGAESNDVSEEEKTSLSDYDIWKMFAEARVPFQEYLLNEIGCDAKKIQELNPEMFKVITEQFASVQRMVLDASISFVSLLDLSPEELTTLFQHEYLVYELIKAKLSFNQILRIILNPDNEEILQHPSSYLQYIKKISVGLLDSIFKNASLSQREELYRHAAEIREIVKDIISSTPVEQAGKIFIDKWFSPPLSDRNEIYEKIGAKKIYYLNYKALLKELADKNKVSVSSAYCAQFSSSHNRTPKVNSQEKEKTNCCHCSIS